MKYKSDAFEMFKEFRLEVEKQLGKSILTLRSYQGDEYLSQEFMDYLYKNEILPQWTTLGHHKKMEFLKGEIRTY